MPIVFVPTSVIKARSQRSQQIQPEERFRWKKAIYRERYHVERFFNKLKQLRRIATRYDKLGATFFAFVQLASVRIWLRQLSPHPNTTLAECVCATVFQGFAFGSTDTPAPGPHDEIDNGRTAGMVG